jgi:hypothetical protein
MSEPLRAPDPDEAPPAKAPAAPGAGPPAHSGTSELTSHKASSKFKELDDLSVEELRARAREHSEAEAAVAAVMRRVELKAEKLAEAEGRRRPKPKPIRLMLLGSLLGFNLYLWMGQPQWLKWHEPPAPSIDFYASSYKIAVYLQRQRIEEYRKQKKVLPAAAKQAGPPVRGVRYSPLASDRYMLEAGKGMRMIVYTSTDSIAVFMGRTLIQMGMLTKGIR